MMVVDACGEAALLSIRDTRVRWRLLDLVKRATADLEADELDIVVLAARRMSCLYSLLRLDGLPAPTAGLVLGDRFLEMSPNQQDWHGKRVLVLDDSRVSGRTLDDRVRRLEAMVGPTGSVVADVVATSSSDGFPSLRSDPIHLDRHEMANLNRDYARVFGRALMPYFTDFVVSAEVEMTVAEFEMLLEHGPWLSVDVTNAAIAGSAHRTYSLMPTDGLASELENLLGPSADTIELCKVRLFTADAGMAVRVRAVPIVSFASLDADSVAAATALSSTFKDGLDPAQVVGMVTFALSQVLLRSFSEVSQKVVGHPFVRDEVISEVNFGPGLDDLVESVLRNPNMIQQLRRTAEVSDGEPGGVQPIKWNTHELDSKSRFLVLGDDLVDPIYNQLTDLADQYEAGEFADVGPDWARLSVSLAAEAGRLGSNPATVSLAVDVLNDLGVAVPHYYLRDSSLFRGYRPGETTLTDLEQGRLGGLLASLANTIAVDDQSGASEPQLVLDLLS